MQWLDGQKPGVGQGPKVKLLRDVFAERYRVEAGGVVLEPMRSFYVHNPHDPDADWGTGRQEWVGYKVQVAETVPEKPAAEGAPTEGFIISMVTQSGSGSDEAGMEQTLAEQAALGLERQSELYVDAASISGQAMAQAEAENRQLVGPAVAARSGEADYGVEDFDVDLAARQAICPAGQPSTQCSRSRTTGMKRSSIGSNGAGDVRRVPSGPSA
jgi:hypothetical protein